MLLVLSVLLAPKVLLVLLAPKVLLVLLVPKVLSVLLAPKVLSVLLVPKVLLVLPENLPFIGDGTGEFEKDYWYFYDDATDKWVKGDYSSATVYAVQNEGLPSFTLHVKDKTTGTELTTILPTAALISSLEGVTIENGKNHCRRNKGT